MARAKTSLRKAPRQERSKATVDALLQATADILVRDGYAKLTTNRVADRAGVNIASLYQFFPGKAALVAELGRRHVEKERTAIREAMRARRGEGAEALTRLLISMGVAAHAVNPKLHHVLTEELPAIQPIPPASMDEELLAEVREHYLLTPLPLPDLELTFWLVSTVSHAAIHRAAVERPHYLRDPRFVDELVLMLTRYLER